MCEPVSITMATLAVGGAVAKGIQAKQQGDAAARAGEASQAMAEQAASTAEQNGAFEAGKVQMKGEAVAGRQVAVQGSSGVVVGEGFLAGTVEDTASLTAIDKQTALNNAQREAWVVRVQGDVHEGPPAPLPLGSVREVDSNPSPEPKGRPPRQLGRSTATALGYSSSPSCARPWDGVFIEGVFGLGRGRPSTSCRAGR